MLCAVHYWPCVIERDSREKLQFCSSWRGEICNRDKTLAVALQNARQIEHSRESRRLRIQRRANL